MPLDAGKLDRRIRIERSVTIDNGHNKVAAWAALASVAAQYIPSAGREAREQLGQDIQLLATFRIRWSVLVSDVGAGDRLRFPAHDDGQVWDIKSAVEIGRREGIEIVAQARAGVTA